MSTSTAIRLESRVLNEAYRRWALQPGARNHMPRDLSRGQIQL